MATHSIAPVVTQQRLAELLHGNGRGVAGVRLANLIGHVEEVGSVLLDGLTAARRIDKIFFRLGSLRQQRLLLNQKGGEAMSTKVYCCRLDAGTVKTGISPSAIPRLNGLS